MTYKEKRLHILEVLRKTEDDKTTIIGPKCKNKTSRIGKTNRDSKFRGVSRNGKKWQVMIMGNMKKLYFGAIATELEAARLYDKLAILSQGLRVSHLINTQGKN